MITTDLSCNRHIFRKRLEAKVNRAAHEGETFVGYFVAMRPLQLANQSMCTQQLQQSAHATIATTFLLRILHFAQAQMAGYVAGVKPPLNMLATQHREEQLLIFFA